MATTNVESVVYAYCENIDGWCWTCPACHANYLEHTKECWLCGQSLNGENKKLPQWAREVINGE